jgi:hypothetical protein
MSSGTTSHHARPTTAPRPPHKTIMRRCFPWSGGFDCIFRNEGVTGSNPVSSTECPGQGVIGAS